MAMQLGNPSGQDINALRDMMKRGLLTEADLANLSVSSAGEPNALAAMFAPRQEPVSRETGPVDQTFTRGGDFESLRQNVRSGQGVIQSTNPDGTKNAPIFIDTTKSQPRQKIGQVYGAGGGVVDSLGSADFSGVPLDSARGQIEIPGLGVGNYGKDGNAYGTNPDGTPWKAILGYNRDATRAEQDRQLKIQAMKDASALSGANLERVKAETTNLQLKPVDQPKPIWDSERGVFVTPPSGGSGAPTVTQVPGLQAKEKPVPQFVAEGVIHNAQAMKTIGNALASLNTPEGENAVGWKAKLPNKILNEYLDPAGVATRADIADVGSLQIKNRSGATVTVGEEPRLLPFIPLPTDDAETAKKKLVRLNSMIESETNALTEFYPGAAKHAEALKSNPQAVKTVPGAVFATLPAASTFAGKRMQGPDGIYKSDGTKWVKQ